MKIKYLQYYTYYKYKLNLDADFNYSHNRGCFSSIYNLVEDYSQTGRIKIFINRDPGLNEKALNNYCILTDNEIKEYIKWIVKVTKIKISISKFQDIMLPDICGSTNYIFVNILLKNNTAFEVKFVLALIRDMYEYPFNAQIKLALLMKDIPELSILDLSQKICIAKNSMACTNWNHSTYKFQIQIISNKKFVERYLYCKNWCTTIQQFYERSFVVDIPWIDMTLANKQIECGKLEENTIDTLLRIYNLMK